MTRLPLPQLSVWTCEAMPCLSLGVWPLPLSWGSLGLFEALLCCLLRKPPSVAVGEGCEMMCVLE